MKHGWLSLEERDERGSEIWRTRADREVEVTRVTGNRCRPVGAPPDLVWMGPVIELVGVVGPVVSDGAPAALGEPAVNADECCTSTCCRAARALAARLTRLHARS